MSSILLGLPTKEITRTPAKTVTIDIVATPTTLATPTSASSSASSTTSSASNSPLMKNHLQRSRSNDDMSTTSLLEIEDENMRSSSSGGGSTWTQRHIIRPFNAKVVTPMVNILKSGATPEGIALSLAFGATGGMFPVPATTTVICLIFVFIFKLNLAAGERVGRK